jgi:hypothetical protein
LGHSAKKKNLNPTVLRGICKRKRRRTVTIEKITHR